MSTTVHHRDSTAVWRVPTHCSDRYFAKIATGGDRNSAECFSHDKGFMLYIGVG